MIFPAQQPAAGKYPCGDLEMNADSGELVYIRERSHRSDALDARGDTVRVRNAMGGWFPVQPQKRHHAVGEDLIYQDTDWPKRQLVRFLQFHIEGCHVFFANWLGGQISLGMSLYE